MLLCAFSLAMNLRHLGQAVIGRGGCGTKGGGAARHRGRDVLRHLGRRRARPGTRPQEVPSLSGMGTTDAAAWVASNSSAHVSGGVSIGPRLRNRRALPGRGCRRRRCTRSRRRRPTKEVVGGAGGVKEAGVVKASQCRGATSITGLRPVFGRSNGPCSRAKAPGRPR